MKWTFEDVKETHNALYQAYLDDVIDDAVLENLLVVLWRISKWNPADYDEEVIARAGEEPGCRLAVERNCNA